MIPGIRQHRVQAGEVRLHVTTAGPEPESGRPPVLLLHGWPQTWYEWRDVIPALAEQYPVIAPDMRGLGDSSRPADGYDKKTVAEDLRLLLEEHFRCEHYHVVGHDWGGPVAFRLAASRPEAALTLSLLDVTVPGVGPNFSQGGVRWHHAFHMTPDLPETLTDGREEAYLRWFYRSFSHRSACIDEEAVEEYVRCYSQPGAMRAGFAYYRNIPVDVRDNQKLLEAGFRLEMPVLGMGGAVTESRGRAAEPASSLREIAGDVTEVVVPESGHFIPEERPDVVIESLRAHLSR